MNYRFTPGSIASAAVGAAATLLYFVFQVDLFAFIPGAGPIIMTIVLVVVAGAGSVWLALRDSRHRRALQRFAHLNGLSYALGTMEFRGKFRSYPFGRGVNQQDVDVLSGHFNGFRCVSFTHRFQEGRDEGRQRTYEYQIDVVPLSYPLATIDIVPDDAFAKISKLLGGQDIDFESYQFNKKWRVKAGDAKYAHDIVHPRMIRRLNEADADGMAIRIEGAAVMAWAVEPRGPEDLARRLGVLTAVARLIPDFVVREFKEVHDRAEEARLKREENAPDWAKTPFALTSGRYTGIGAEDYPEIEWPPRHEDHGRRLPTTPRPPEDPGL